MDPSMTFFLKGLGVIAAANTLFTLVRAFSFAAAGMSAAARLHQQLLGVVLAAPVTWFDVHPPGRVLNR
jgi:ATP-binding cassette subfamily C (CFTR/MRP) protein 10